MSFYFAAKSDLASDANETGIIPWSSIHLYAQTYGLDVEEFDDLVRYIRAMEKGLHMGREKESEKKKDGKAS